MASHSECPCPCSFQVVMVFPGPRAVSVQDMIQHLHDQSNSRLRYTSDEPKKKRLKCDELEDSTCTAESSQTGTAETKDTESRQCPLQRVVFIDSTWNQTNKISTDERLQGNQAFLYLFTFHTILGHWGLTFLQICCKWSWRWGKLVFGVIRRENQTPTWRLLRLFIIFLGITTSIVSVSSMMENMIISSSFTPSCTRLSTKLRLREKREISSKNCCLSPKDDSARLQHHQWFRINWMDPTNTDSFCTKSHTDGNCFTQTLTMQISSCLNHFK